MSLEWVTAISTAVQAVATVVLVIMAVVQLGRLSDQLRQSANQERVRNTLEVIRRVESDVYIRMAYDKVAEITKGGSDYTGTDTPECKFHIITILNYLEEIATGIAQNVYVDQMVRDNLQEVLRRAVDVWLIGGPSDAFKAPSAMFGQDEFAQLRKLYKLWFPKPETKYRAE